jgi:hypothetical protein
MGNADRPELHCRIRVEVVTFDRSARLSDSADPRDFMDGRYPMDQSRCPQCKKRLMAMTDKAGRTTLVCLKCDRVDPMETDAVKWANSGLAAPASAQ